jgi:rod shape determining protein RodA
MWHFLKKLDFVLLAVTFALLLISFVMIFSASTVQLEGQETAYLALFKQLFACLLGLTLMIIFILSNYRTISKLWWVLYILICAFLLYVLYYGHASQGAQRWINLGFFSIQPSEIAKLVMVITLAAVLHKKEALMRNTHLLPAIILAGIPFILIASQPDLGTALVFIAILFSILIAAQTSGPLLFALFSPILSLAIFFGLPYFYHAAWIIYLVVLMTFFIRNKMPWIDILVYMFLNIGIVFVLPHFFNFLKPYQQERLTVFINPHVDPLAQGVRYHIDKSITAVGSGGLWGQGFMSGALSHLQYIPVQNSDFIFSVIAEELGFLGAGLMITLLGLVVFRALKIAQTANDSFGSLLAIGIASYLLFQIVVNIGMTLGLMPVVGIPLPLVSYGGSALVTNLAAIGLLQSISCRREKLFF